MAYFPMFVDLKDKKCVVIGGGKVAFRKVASLLEFEAAVIVIAESILPQIRELAENLDQTKIEECDEKGKQIEIRERSYNTDDITDAYLVIAATDDAAINKVVAADCRNYKIPVNVVDTQEECGFIFPAYIRRGAVTVGITSSGKSPVMTKRIKANINKALPDYTALLTENLGKAREWVKREFQTEAERKCVFEKLAELGMNKEGNLKEEDIRRVIQELKNIKER